MLPGSATEDHDHANWRSTCSETTGETTCGDRLHMTDAGAMARKRAHERASDCSVEVEEVE